MAKGANESKREQNPVLTTDSTSTKKLYIESYDYQVNFSNSEIMASILLKVGYNTTDSVDDVDLMLVNACSIRGKTEQTIRRRLEQFNVYERKKSATKMGVLGYMVERVKHAFLEKGRVMDMVTGPNAYKDLPNLPEEVEGGRETANVILSKDRIYVGIAPTHLNSNGVTAFISVTRGCDNICTFCIMPFTRERKHNHNSFSTINEVDDLQARGFKEVTLLGQNVDSYLWYGDGLKKDSSRATEIQQTTAINFVRLLDMVAITHPKMRIRFSTFNPQDMTFKIIDTVAEHHDIYKCIHPSAQSGSNRILKATDRTHTHEEYLALIGGIRRRISDCAISQDTVTDFLAETEEDHRDTLSLMEYVEYGFGSVFVYSERLGTSAARGIADDVSGEMKKRRLAEIIDLQQTYSLYHTRAQVGNIIEVLIGGSSKKSDQRWTGRNSQNAMVAFPKEDCKIDNFAVVKITGCISTTLIGKAVGYSEYFN